MSKHKNNSKKLLVVLVTILLTGMLIGAGAAPIATSAAIKQCTEWECTCIDPGPPPGGGAYKCLLRCTRECWDPDDPQYDWDEVKYGVCPCPGEPTPTPAPIPTPTPTPRLVESKVTIYVTAGPNEWVQLTSEDGRDVWWVGRADKVGGLILRIPVVRGLKHRFYNPAHNIAVIRNLATEGCREPVDLHPDRGCVHCIRE